MGLLNFLLTVFSFFMEKPFNYYTLFVANLPWRNFQYYQYVMSLIPVFIFSILRPGPYVIRTKKEYQRYKGARKKVRDTFLGELVLWGDE